MDPEGGEGLQDNVEGRDGVAELPLVTGSDFPAALIAFGELSHKSHYNKVLH